jgi:hypothetical protein
MTEPPSAIPDGLDARAYAYTDGFSRPEWAWEFLRRNPEFRRQMVVFSAQVTSERRVPNTIICRVGSKAPLLLAWGLRFRGLRRSPDAGLFRAVGSRDLPFRHSDPDDRVWGRWNGSQSLPRGRKDMRVR